MVGPREQEASFWGGGREREKNDSTKQQTLSLQEQAANLWVTQPKVLVVGQLVTREWLH